MARARAARPRSSRSARSRRAAAGGPARPPEPAERYARPSRSCSLRVSTESSSLALGLRQVGLLADVLETLCRPRRRPRWPTTRSGSSRAGLLAGGDDGALSGGEVADRGAEHGDLLGGRRVVVGLGQRAVHAQAAERRGEEHRDGEGQRQLAPQGPLGKRDGRRHAVRRSRDASPQTFCPPRLVEFETSRGTATTPVRIEFTIGFPPHTPRRNAGTPASYQPTQSTRSSPQWQSLYNGRGHRD